MAFGVLEFVFPAVEHGVKIARLIIARVNRQTLLDDQAGLIDLVLLLQRMPAILRLVAERFREGPACLTVYMSGVIVCHMPSFEEHCLHSLVRFGRDWAPVHKWLDELAGRPPHGMRHRKFRHHLAGIEEVRQKWGSQAAEVAKDHIVADLKMDAWDKSQGIPRDPADYERRGLY